MLPIVSIIAIIGFSANISLVLALCSEDESHWSQIILPGCINEAVDFNAPLSGEKYYQTETAAVFSYQGRTSHMEDTFAMEEDFGDPAVSLYGVFDGHSGQFAAKYMAKNLLVRMKNKIAEIRKKNSKGKQADYTVDGAINYKVLLSRVILDFEKYLLENNESGTTAVVALITGGKVYVANLGNSRAVMGVKNKNANQINTDCTSIVALTIAEPNIYVDDLSELDSKFIILASKGLWDAYTSEEAANFIHHDITSELFGTRDLAISAKIKGSEHNITVMVIKTETFKLSN